MAPIRMAQYGVGHGHAEGKLFAMRSSPDVELAGVCEPNAARRAAVDRPGTAFEGVRWFESPAEMLEDPSIVAIAAEGRNDESLSQAAEIIGAGKHLWYDKPAGDDWTAWWDVAADARERRLHLQMGYMFRYHAGFRRMTDWAKAGLLGEIFSVRAHMSTFLDLEARRVIARHRGGIFYDLAGHMIDQIVWLLGQPTAVAGCFRSDGAAVPGFADNTVGVLQFPKALAMIDIAAMETPPMARRFEIFGSRGSAIMEPFEPAGAIRLCLAEAGGEWAAGVHQIPVPPQSRQDLYDLELAAFVETLRGRQAPERPLDHDITVQETLLRLTGGIAG
jgi:predicted dehydrogenase